MRLIIKLLHHPSHFWIKHPAALAGFTLLFATFFACGAPIALLPFLVMLLSLSKKHILFATVLFLSFVCFVKISFYVPQKDLQGHFSFTPHRVKKIPRAGWHYFGKVKIDESPLALPCSWFTKKFYNPNCRYSIEGTLIQKDFPYFQLKAEGAPQVEQELFSLAGARQQMKERFKKYLQQEISHKKSASFLAGLATGELDDKILLKEFERRGLSHLLAISGFHFVMLASVIQFFLRAIFPQKVKAAFLIVFLSAYFIFIGNTPSIERAWIGTIVYLLGELFEKRANGINNLGLALFVTILIDPLSVFNIGLQLSYLATLGILLFYAPLSKRIERIVPFSFLAKSLALTFSVYLILLMPLLYHFHTLPLHGIVYNLFFPFLVTLSFVLLIVGTLAHLIFPLLAHGIHVINTHYTHLILDMLEIRFFPHYTFYVETMPMAIVVICLTALIGSTIYLREGFRSELPFEFL